MELFLLDCGIEAEFWESEYAQFWQDAVFGNTELENFDPDIVYIHTSLRNLSFMPEPGMTVQQVDAGFGTELERFRQMWDSIEKRFSCPVIQNNFELPFYRVMGNSEAASPLVL